MMQPEEGLFNEDDDDWNSLQTIQTFDGVNDTIGMESRLQSNASTRILGNSIMNMFAAKATTPVSLLVESLIQQLCTMLEPDSQRSKSLYDAICEQLHQMNLIDETWEMGEFETMRSQYQRALYQLVSVARGQDLPVALQSVWPLTQPVGMDWSRYHREFEELSFIAGGGFGKVFKARNRLDGIVYAVKKVTIKSTTISRVLSHLSEVKTLAGLNHINIVPYKAAWLEPLLANGSKSELGGVKLTQEDGEEEEEEDDDENENDDDGDDNDDDDDEEYETNEVCENGKKNTSKRSYQIRKDDSSDFIQFEASNPNNNNEDTGWKSEDQSMQTRCNKSNAICRYKKSFSIEESKPHVKLTWATLFIQMSLCQITLRDWLDQRNKSDNFEDFYTKFLKESESKHYSIKRPNTSFHCLSRSNNTTAEMGRNVNHQLSEMSDSSTEECPEELNHPTHLDVVSDIFAQLINGLNYIHARGIVHHDIKPSNIFVGVENESKLIVQLGDFGLACPLQNSHSGNVFGTPLYAAPEQLNGQCNAKSDIYSLGIILLELLLRLNTDMERVRTIDAARKGQLPDSINPQFNGLLKKLLQSHRKRPDTIQLIEIINRMQANKDHMISELQRRLSEQDQEIQTLKTIVEERHTIDVQLKTKHSEIECKNEEIRFKEMELQIKDQEILTLRNRIIEMENKNLELQSKDEEINKLKRMLSNRTDPETKE